MPDQCDDISDLISKNGRYELLYPIGSGANSDVYLVQDKKLDKVWALKVTKHLSDNELSLLKSVNHPAFPRIIDTLEVQDTVGLLMDYIPGRTLDTLCRSEGIPSDHLYAYAVELADALAYLHNMNPPILYLDCKPQNTILGDDGHIHLIDLGSAYITGYSGTQRISGTLPYAAPEQRSGKKVDVRSDIYAYGMTLYALIGAPDRSINAMELICRHLRSYRDKTTLTRIIRRCLFRDPKKRYQSFGEVLRHLNNPRLLGFWDISMRNILIRSADILYKSFTALFCILSFITYNALMQRDYLMLGTALFALLAALSLRIEKRHKTYGWTCKKDVFLGNISAVLLTMLICIIVCITAISEKGHAFEVTPDISTTVNIYDAKGNLVLYKGQRLVTDGDSLYLYIPTGSISADHIPVRIKVSPN